MEAGRAEEREAKAAKADCCLGHGAIWVVVLLFRFQLVEHKSLHRPFSLCNSTAAELKGSPILTVYLARKPNERNAQDIWNRNNQQLPSAIWLTTSMTMMGIMVTSCRSMEPNQRRESVIELRCRVQTASRARSNAPGSAQCTHTCEISQEEP
jgi:hypothetical protein